MKVLKLALAALAASTAAALADARATVDQLAAAMAAKDAAAITALFTDDAGYAYALEGDLKRGDGFDTWLQSDIIGPGSVFNIENAEVKDGIVDAAVVWGRDAPANPARYVFTLIGGKIDSWRIANR
jgi:hypothetical protein